MSAEIEVAAASSTDDNSINEPNYKLCCLYNEEDEKCGPWTRDRPNRFGLVSVDELTADVVDYLKSIGFKNLDKKKLCEINERQLIENRLKRNLENGTVICEYHRNFNGVGWRRTKDLKHCCHKDHPYQRGKKSTRADLAPFWMALKFNELSVFSFIIGGVVCRKHILKFVPEPKTVETENEDENNEESENEDENDVESEAGGADHLDDLFHPDEVLVDEALQSQSLQTCNQLTTMLGISPIHWQLVKTPASNLGERSKSDLR